MPDDCPRCPDCDARNPGGTPCQAGKPHETKDK